MVSVLPLDAGFGKMYIHQPCARRAQRHPQTDRYYGNIITQLLAVYVQYKCTIQKMLIPQPYVQRAHRHPPTDTYSPIVGSVISNTNVHSGKCTFTNPAPEGRTDTL